MRITFILLFAFLAHVNIAKADTSIACLNCSSTQAETKALFEGRKNVNGNNFYQEKFAIFDPVTNITRTFIVSIIHEEEMPNDTESVQLTSNLPEIVEAVDAYHKVIVGFYNHMNSIKPSTEPDFNIYSSPNAAPSSAPTAKKDINGWLYNLIRGNAIYNFDHPSYAWMTNDINNQLTVSGELSALFALDSLSSLMSMLGKQAFAELVLQLPLQYTVRFNNGDTVSFFFDCLCSIEFLPLHETAKDQSGNKLNSTTETGGNSPGEITSYNSFYTATGRNGQSLQQVCTTVYTGSGGNNYPQQVCWVSYF